LDEEERPWVREGDITLLHTEDPVSIFLLFIKYLVANACLFDWY
jgi:hypothetical protein